MFRYLAGILAGFALFFAVAAALFYGSLGLAVDFGERNPAAWYQIKESATRKAGPRAKIVLVGGSNVLFGLRAEEIQRQLGRPCINFGTYAGLPFGYLLDRVKGVLRRGDVVVLSPEWTYLDQVPDQWNETSLAFILGSDSEYFRQLSFPRQAAAILSAKPKRFLLPLILSRWENSAIQNAVKDSVLVRQLNVVGDFVDNAPNERPADAAEKIKLTHVSMFNLEAASAGTPFWKACEDFLGWCRERRIRVFYAAPTLFAGAREVSEKGPPYFDLAEKHYEAIGIPVLTRQSENLYPDNLMFDSIYHLNSQGSAIQTARLAEKLKTFSVEMRDRGNAR